MHNTAPQQRAAAMTLALGICPYDTLVNSKFAVSQVFLIWVLYNDSIIVSGIVYQENIISLGGCPWIAEHSKFGRQWFESKHSWSSIHFVKSLPFEAESFPKKYHKTKFGSILASALLVVSPDACALETLLWASNTKLMILRGILIL